MAGMDLGVVLAERAVADVVQKILDLPVASDPVRELGAGDRAGRQAGDQVDTLDGELAAGEVPPPAGQSTSSAWSYWCGVWHVAVTGGAGAGPDREE